MASRTLRLEIEWEDDGEPDTDANGNPAGYMAFMLGLSNLGAEVLDEREV